MGHIKEPKGVDFIIVSDPLTDKARLEISKFISDYEKRKSLKRLRREKSISQALKSNSSINSAGMQEQSLNNLFIRAPKNQIPPLRGSVRSYLLFLY